MIRRTLLPACILTLAAIPAAAQPSASAREAWRSDVPCTAGPRPALRMADTTGVDARLPGCGRASCITLPDGRRVCSCTGDTTVTTRVMDQDRVVQEWTPSRSSMEMTRVLQGDLDGDGRAETIVSELVDFGNGLGVRYEELRILDGRHPARTPLVVRVDDYAADGSWVRPAAGGDCRLIATRWQTLGDARRGEGTYLVGQWMRYRDGRLEHDAGRPVVVRRLLDSFADARGITPGEPFAHLRHRNAEARRDGYYAVPQPFAGRGEATIRRVGRSDADSLEVALASGQTEHYRIGQDFGDASSFGEVWTWLVDGATGRPYPRGYAPADRGWLDGARATLTRYDNGAGARINLLVLGR